MSARSQSSTAPTFEYSAHQSPNTPVSLPADTVQREINRLLRISPEYVADSSRNYQRLYVRDCHALIQKLWERMGIVSRDIR
jgi:hypothetical protein